MAQNIIKKLSVANVFGKIDPKKLDAGGTVLFRAIGCASGLKSGQTNYGEWTALTGDFAAVKADGEIMRASQMFLPDVILNMVQPRIEQGQAVEFAMDVVAIPDATSKTGYVYAASQVIAPDAATDPVARLMAKIESETKQLEAPKETASKKK